MDTRMGTIVKHYSKDDFYRILKSGYHEREFDKFPGIDYEEFQSHYRARDRITLRHSIRTIILEAINDFVRETIKNNINTPFIQEPRVIVNCHPYKLVLEEKRLIANVIRSLVHNAADVILVDVPYSEMTPSYLKEEEVSLLVIYDYDQWLESQSVNGNFAKKACPEIGMFAPAIYKKEMLSEEDLRIQASLSEPPFVYLGKTIQPFVKAAFLPAAMFSIPVTIK